LNQNNGATIVLHSTNDHSTTNGAMKFHVGTNFKSGLAVEISSTLSDLVDLLLSWQLKFLGKLKMENLPYEKSLRVRYFTKIVEPLLEILSIAHFSNAKRAAVLYFIATFGARKE
jgi:hypothetical protein